MVTEINLRHTAVASHYNNWRNLLDLNRDVHSENFSLRTYILSHKNTMDGTQAYGWAFFSVVLIANENL